MVDPLYVGRSVPPGAQPAREPPTWRDLSPHVSTMVKLAPAAAYFRWYHGLDADGQRDATRYFRALDPGIRADIEQYRREAPLSHVVEIHDASHWVFLSHRGEVLKALRAFLAAGS